MQFKIENVQVYGFERAIKASGNPMRTKFDRSEVTEKDMARVEKLGTSKSGAGHDNFLKGVVVQLDVTAPYIGGNKHKDIIGLTLYLVNRQCIVY